MSKAYQPERKKLFLWLILIFLAISSSLLLSETLLRILYREEEVNGEYWGIGAFEHSDLTGYVHASGFEGFAARKGVFISPVKINSLGLRQSNFEQQLKYPRKVLLLGDSFVFGLGVREEQTFAAQIQNNLNSIYIGIVNGAQTGFSVEQERLFGILLIERVNPDIVIVGLYTNNDIFGDYYKRYKNADVRFGYRLSKDRLFKIAPIDFLRTHSYVWMRINGVIPNSEQKKIYREFKRISEKETQRAIQPTLDSLVKLNDYCKANNIVFGVLMIPPKYGSTRFDSYIKTSLSGKKINLMDLSTKQYTTQDYFIGDGHWNVKGHQKAVPHVEMFIEKLLSE